MQLIIATIIIGTMATLAPAAQLPVGSTSNNRNFAIRSGSTFKNVDLTDYDGKILLIMMMTPWCPFCQSNAQAVGDGILDHFNSTSRGTLRGKNANGVEIHSILLSTEEAASWDTVNTSFATTNGYENWGLDANALRGNPRQNLGYFRGDFIASSNLYDWGNDRRRVVVLNLVKNSASHNYREIVINQNFFSSANNPASRSAIDAIQAAPVITAPAITTHPLSTAINSGGTVTLITESSGTSPALQWYLGDSGDTSQPILGATSLSYMTPALTVTTRYWVRATNSLGIADSLAATVSIQLAPVFTAPPVSQTINSGATATLTFVATGISPTFQWYVGDSGDISQPILNAIGVSFTTPALTTRTNYWVRASNAAGDTDSPTVTVRVRTRPAITRQPVRVAILSGRTARLRVVATGTSPTFQWYQGAPGNTKSPVKGATTATFATQALKKTTTFWVRIANPAGYVNSKAVTVTVKPARRIVSSGSVSGWNVEGGRRAPI